MAILIKIMDFIGKILLVVGVIWLVGYKVFSNLWDSSIIRENKPPKPKEK